MLMIFLLSSCSSKGIAVTIENKSGHRVENVVLRYTGGTKEVKEIEDDTSWTGHIDPNGESHLEIDFIDQQNRKHHSKIDTYFEKGYQGMIIITIGQNGKVKFQDEVKIEY
jgi:hypothetical protein